MGLLKDMLASYAATTSSHTGLHYVPSFNDLNSGSNDDLECEVLTTEHKNVQDVSLTPAKSAPSAASPGNPGCPAGLPPHKDVLALQRTALPHLRAPYPLGSLDSFKGITVGARRASVDVPARDRAPLRDTCDAEDSVRPLRSDVLAKSRRSVEQDAARRPDVNDDVLILL